MTSVGHLRRLEFDDQKSDLYSYLVVLELEPVAVVALVVLGLVVAD